MGFFKKLFKKPIDPPKVFSIFLDTDKKTFLYSAEVCLNGQTVFKCKDVWAKLDVVDAIGYTLYKNQFKYGYDLLNIYEDGHQVCPKQEV